MSGKGRNTNVQLPEDWHRWCRLCAKADVENINIFIKERNNYYDQRNLAISIGKYFDLEIAPDDQLPLLLCTKCFFLIESLRKFSKRVIKVQEMYNALLYFPKNAKEIDLDYLRLIYGVFEDDRPHEFMQLSVVDNKMFEEEECMYENETFLAEGTDRGISMATGGVELKKDEVTKDFTSLTYENGWDFDNQDVNSDKDPFGNVIEPHHESENVKDGCGNKSANNEDTSEEKSSNLSTLKIYIPNESIEKNNKREDKSTEIAINSTIDTECKEDSEAEKPFTCTECSKGFQIFSCYRRHMKHIHGKPDVDPYFVCPECPSISFNTQTQLNHHHTLKHLPKEERRNFPCTYCDQKYLTKTARGRHIKFVHMNERSFICEECGEAVYTKNLLDQHMLTHTDYAPFECEICKGCFKNQIRLKKHMQSHNPNKYTCKECGKKLSTVATLNGHLLVHSDKMPHKCDCCGRAFKRTKELRNHLIIHAGLKPYSCEFCDRTFANGANYRAHQKRAHPEEFAALRASGEKTCTKNIPKLAVLKALAKTAENLLPVASKRKKSKLPSSIINTAVSTSKTSETNSELTECSSNVDDKLLHSVSAEPNNSTYNCVENNT